MAHEPDAFAMFDCARRRLRLSVPGCARLFLSARADRPLPHEGRHGCLGCPVGAAHAGVELPPSPAIEALHAVCPRCRRVNGRIIHGRLCVSCYNREREVRVGRNRKGGVPRLAARLHRVRIAVTDGAGHARVVERDAVDLAEMLISTAQAATGPVTIGVAAFVLRV